MTEDGSKGDAAAAGDTDGGNAAPADGADPAQVDLSRLLEAGGRGGDRSGGLAFLALLVILGAALHFYFAAGGYAATDLDADLRRHAELRLAAHRENPNLAVVPAWPMRLYGVLRRDLALYLAAAAAAAYLWGMSVRARARRDAYLVHENCRRELEGLRERLLKLEPPQPEGAGTEQAQGIVNRDKEKEYDRGRVQ